MSLTKNEILNELYNGVIITFGAVGISAASQKLFKENFNVTPRNLMNIFKMSAAFGMSSVLIHWAQKMNYIPDEPFKYI